MPTSDRAVAPTGASGASSAPGFPVVGGGSRKPSRRSRPRRAAFAVLALANRLVPKTDKVLVSSTVDVEDGLLAVADEAAARGWPVVVLLANPGNARLIGRLSKGTVQTVPKRSARGLLHYLTARFVMTTNNIYGNGRPPPTQVVVALWHGEPPTKVTARFEGKGGLECTYAPVCSTVGRAYRAVEFGLDPLRVPIIGAPRNDRMLRADAAAVRRLLLGEDSDRPTLVWMPSYRSGRYGAELRVDVAGVASSSSGLPFETEDVRRLDEWLDQRGARIVVKVHPRDAQAFPTDLRAMRVLRQEDLLALGVTLYQVLPVFDGLLTDMSSVWLDYLLLDKPMVFPFPDMDAYRAGRGLNVEPYEHWVPGPLARTLDDLMVALGELLDGRDPMADERSRARLRFHQHHDDQSTARLLDGLGITAR